MGQVCARRQAIDALKVIAIFMVLNSHLDFLYPIPALAAGGAAGNSLFFIISGFFVRFKDQKKHGYSINLLDYTYQSGF